MPETPAPLHIHKGHCYALFAYDVGQGIDLGECRKHITALTEETRIKHKSRAPSYFEYTPAPLRVTQYGAPLPVGPYRTTGTVESVLYDFGAVSICYNLEFSGTLEELRNLSRHLEESHILLEDSRAHVKQLLASIRPAVRSPYLFHLKEEYTIFQAESFSTPVPVEEIHSAFGPLIAQVLRAEEEPLSQQELADAASTRVSFGPGDVTFIDWNAALLFDDEADDVRAVLEFANVELLEMRFLDGRLDKALDEIYEIMGAARGPGLRLPRASAADLRRVAELQVDAALLFERVSNALKLMGDQYLARLYRLASQRFRLAEWNSGILRKLDVLDGIYVKLTGQAAARRMEFLEWIIVVLIAAEIALSLFR